MPVPFTPTTRMTSGSPSTFCTGFFSAVSRIASNSSFNTRFSSSTLLDLLAVDFLTQGQKTVEVVAVPRSAASNVAFQVVERLAINLFADGNDILDALAEAFARARDRLFHALQKTGFFFGTAK